MIYIYIYDLYFGGRIKDINMLYNIKNLKT